MTDDELVLPELQDALLDLATIRQLFFDVSHASTLLEVRVKRGPVTHADEGPPGPDEARALLESGEALAVQLRYLHRGTEWLDTVMRTPSGYRLVRMGTPAPEP